MTHEDLDAFRAAKDEFFKTDYQSPIEDPSAFPGLRYFPPEPDFVLKAMPIPGDEEPITVQTSDGAERQYVRTATVDLETPEGPATLTLFTTEGSHGFFVPFRDATSGIETYGAGRYLDVAADEDGSVTIDFNLAYNPYCAYSDAYSCPLPPAENWLAVAIRAGEKSPA